MGDSDSVSYLQSEVQEMFGNALYKVLLVWLNDLLAYGDSYEALFKLLTKILVICKAEHPKVNPNKCDFWKKEALWCDRVVSGEGVGHGPAMVCALVHLPRPSAVDELQQFVCPVNWMQHSIPLCKYMMEKMVQVLETVYEVAHGRTECRAQRIHLIEAG